MITFENKEFYSIFEINDYIKSLFDNTLTLQNIGLIGEVSNFKGVNRSGHYYFTLKDEKSSINAVIFKYDALKMDFNINNGDQVLVIGSVSSYAVSGAYQIIIKKVIEYGEGSILLKKEKLKKKLENMGIFDKNHKKSLSYLPRNICVITGKNSAAEKDFAFNLSRRNPLSNVVFKYAKVQGKEAKDDIIKTLNEADSKNYDLIILGRGGGASEDLSVFDEEDLVMAIYNLNTPIITAIGHEINLSLSDLASDKYASTPTGACEVAVPDINEIIEELEHFKDLLKQSLKYKISILENKVNEIKSKKCFISIENYYSNFIIKLENYKKLLILNYANYLKLKEHKLNELELKLKNNNINEAFNKGFVLVYKDKKLIKSKKELGNHDEIEIIFKDGSVKAKVEE